MTRPPADDGTLAALLRRAAHELPDTVALVDRGRSTTYRGLAEKSHRLARRLAAAGIGRGHRVGIHLPRGLEACVALFATLERGAVAVPLAADGPAERNRRIADDCALRGLVSTTAGARSLFPDSEGRGLALSVLVDAREASPGLRRRELAWERALEGPTERPAATSDHRPGPSDLAYLLYTSGSTGAPKGVMITHEAARAFVDWAVACFELGPEDRVAGVAAIHFDLSIFDLFATCAAGACHLPLPADAWLHPERIRDRLLEERISTWYSTPSTLQLLMARGGLESGRFPALRQVLFAGEVFPGPQLETLRKILPGTRLCNLYGPTETNVCAWQPVPAKNESLPRELPIGEPIQETEARVAGVDGHEVEAGEVGELWVSGPTLCRGYWQDPRRTAATLVPGTNRRWYRTGDLVCRGEGGELLFRGRRDHMVKLRGYRIEIGEVEAALYEHPAISEAAVARREESGREARLCAWIVPLGDEKLSTLALRVFLGRKIPPYMIPAEITICDSLPRTTTGKIDRRALASS